MCESWVYGCGHAIRTPCPRPKPTMPAAVSSINASSSPGSNISNTNASTPHTSSRHNSTTTSSLLILTPTSKFCNGFPLSPRETSAPCYNCILAEARLKIALEKPEVEAKKHELLRNHLTRPMIWGPDGRYADEFGNNNNIMAEEAYEPGFGILAGPGGRQDQGRESGATTW